MTDEIIVKKKKPATLIDRNRPYFGPMAMWKELDTVFEAFRNQFDNHFLHPFRPIMVHPAMEARIRLPAMDFQETEEAFILTIEVPGVKKEDIDISLTNTGIDISAESSAEKKEKSECYVCQERSSTSFKRSFEFPEEIVSDRARASMENGILKIVLPKKEPEPKVEAKKLDIE